MENYENLTKVGKCVVKCYPRSEHMTIKDYLYFMTKFIAILATDNFYFCKSCLIIVNFVSNQNMLGFKNLDQ